MKEEDDDDDDDNDHKKQTLILMYVPGRQFQIYVCQIRYQYE